MCHFPIDGAVRLHLRVVAHATQQPVRDARRAARSAGDLLRALGSDRHPEHLRRVFDDALQFLRRVVVEMVDDPEALAQRRGEQPCAGRRADQRELLEVDLDGLGVRAAIHHEIDREVLHRRVEELFHDVAEPVDLVHEQHVATAEIGQDPDEVAGPLERRA